MTPVDTGATRYQLNPDLPVLRTVQLRPSALLATKAASPTATNRPEA